MLVMKGVEVAVEILRRENTELITGYPRNPLIEAAAKVGIRPILARQERVGVGIADGYARVRGDGAVGVFVSQGGPGIENAFPGVAQAYSENVPVLVIPSGPATGRISTQPVFNAVDNYGGVTKWSARAHDVQELPGLMRQASRHLRTGKPGPVLLEIADPVWSQGLEGELEYEPVKVYRSAPDARDVERAVELLLAAEHPVIWAGQGVLRARASRVLVRFAELLDAPVLTTNPGKSAFPETHPLSLGAAAGSAPAPLKEFLEASDLVFAVGSSLTRTPFGPDVPAGKRIIQSTNHEPDIDKDYAVEHALVGDAGLTLDALIHLLEASSERPASSSSRAEAAAHAKQKWLSEWKGELQSDEVPINPYRVVWDLMRAVDRDNVIMTHDSGSPREQLLPFWECTVPGSYIGWGKSTQLGYGLALTMGAKLASPDKLCINIMGDAAIGMVGTDLETAVRSNIGTLTIVFNNGVMAIERVPL